MQELQNLTNIFWSMTGTFKSKN